MAKNKESLSAKQLIFRERLLITVLVMAVLAIFVFGVGFLVPYFQNRSIASEAYKSLDQTIVNAINATYGYGSSDNIAKENEDVFVIIVDEDGMKFLPESADTKTNRTYYENLYKANPSPDGRKNSAGDDYYFSSMNSYYIEENLAIEKSPQLITVPIDVPDEAVVYAGINRKTELESSRQFAIVLFIVLGLGFLVMIPIVYLISNRVVKPTKDTLRHEKEFVANASHELKTPLAIITADAEILRDKNPDNYEYVSNIISQCANMNETVLDMIDLSKLETGQRVLQKVDFSQLLLNLCLSFDALAFERQIDYAYDIQEGVTLEKADPKNLKRLANLLIDNAMKYTEDPKYIRVTLKKLPNKKVLFKVYNTGCQINDEEREKVFERFYQGKSGADNERKGSGLGLAIVKQICETYNYTITIDSHYHKDMCFTILMK